jgi:selenium-binding protein 1
LNIYDWKEHRIIQRIDLGDDGRIPLEIRFVHDPKKGYGFVGSAIPSNVFLFYKDDKENKWKAQRVIFNY